MPFLRSQSIAFSMSPADAASACLQSIIGAPVLSRRSRTCAAEMFTVLVPISDAFPSTWHGPECPLLSVQPCVSLQRLSSGSTTPTAIMQNSRDACLHDLHELTRAAKWRGPHNI